MSGGIVRFTHNSALFRHLDLIEASGIIDVCTPAFLIYAVVRTLRMCIKQQTYLNSLCCYIR